MKPNKPIAEIVAELRETLDALSAESGKLDFAGDEQAYHNYEIQLELCNALLHNSIDPIFDHIVDLNEKVAEQEELLKETIQNHHDALDMINEGERVIEVMELALAAGAMTLCMSVKDPYDGSELLPAITVDETWCGKALAQCKKIKGESVYNTPDNTAIPAANKPGGKPDEE